MAAAVLPALSIQVAYAQDPDLPPNPHHEAARVVSAEVTISQALEEERLLAAQPAGPGMMDAVRHQMAVDAAEYKFRVGARQEELRIYELASYAADQAAVEPLLSPSVRPPIDNAILALHSLYALSGIDQYYLVNVHFLHPYGDAQPVAALRSYYLEAQKTYGVDASYFASINFIESNFGRVNGPSSAGAQGPMQFLPGTWQNYGEGGDINDPHAAIMAAGRYLVHYGAPGNMRQAIFHYNLDYDYVDSVEFFARAIRADPNWLDHLYYWNTTG